MMEKNIIWLFVSFSYIAILVLIGFILYRFFHFKSESVRKFIHIFTSNWIFIVLYKMDNPFLMLLGPFSFIFINAFFVYCGFGKYLGMDNRKRDNGLIYYPLSIFILTLSFILGYVRKENVISGVLIMGWGDGLAALIGTHIGKHNYNVFSRYKKSIEGTLTMFIASLIVLLIFSDSSFYILFLVALIATLLENITPFGFDNITVPIASSFILEALCHL